MQGEPKCPTPVSTPEIVILYGASEAGTTLLRLHRSTAQHVSSAMSQQVMVMLLSKAFVGSLLTRCDRKQFGITSCWVALSVQEQVTQHATSTRSELLTQCQGTRWLLRGNHLSPHHTSLASSHAPSDTPAYGMSKGPACLHRPGMHSRLITASVLGPHTRLELPKMSRICLGMQCTAGKLAV